MDKKDQEDQTIIIGAGPAGLSAAYELTSKFQKKVLVLEADERYVGGIARTCEYKGFRFDLGGHRFYSKNTEIEDLWRHWLGSDFMNRQRLSRIYFSGKFFDYPIRLANVMGNLGIWQSIQILVSYVLRRLKPFRPETSLRDWVSNRFGDRLFKMFFKAYTEKVWGVPCEQLSADWAAQRIQNLSIPHILLSSLGLSRKKTAKSLIKSFHYPKLGPGMAWERVQQIVEDDGGKVLLGQKVVQIRHSAGLIREVVTQDTDGRSQSFLGSHVISSMPLTSLVLNLDPPAPENVQASARALSYRDFLIVVLIIEASDLFPDNWIYIHDPLVRVGRIQNFKNWSPYMIPEGSTSTSLGLEYFCTEDDDLWQEEDADLLLRGQRELKQIGLLHDEAVVDGTVYRVHKAYPVYDEEYKKHVAIIRTYLAEHMTNLQVVGRNGMHRYNNQDHAMMTGLLAARNISSGDNFDVWKVNVDSAYLEER
jgi:protoporphyrinogen oxidase